MTPGKRDAAAALIAMHGYGAARPELAVLNAELAIAAAVTRVAHPSPGQLRCPPSPARGEGKPLQLARPDSLSPRGRGLG
jgi:hypothetical protein